MLFRTGVLVAMCGIGVALYHSPSSGSADVPSARIPTTSLQRRGPDAQGELVVGGLHTCGFELRLSGAVLHMRGATCQPQPVQTDAGDALLWNGEIFGGAIEVTEGEGDTAKLLAALVGATEPDVPALMGSIHGPWAFAYWHAASRTLWYGRDGLGRRSLLRAEARGGTDVSACSALLLCSVAEPLQPLLPSGPLEPAPEWEELPANGLGRVRVLHDGTIEHEWLARTASLLRPPAHLAPQLAAASVPPPTDDAPIDAHALDAAAATLLEVLSGAVRRRVCDVPVPVPVPPAASRGVARPDGVAGAAAPVGVLFSGGIDSMVLARLADLVLPVAQPIELITVAFGETPHEAPDRLTALNGFAELVGLSPARPWRLVEVDVTLAMLHAQRGTIEALLAPARTVMDLNIGAALWFGARGVGRLRTRAPPPCASHLCRYADEPTPPSPSPSTAAAAAAAAAAAGAPVAGAVAALRVRVEVVGEDGDASLRLSVDLLSANAGDADDADDGGGDPSSAYRSGARVLLLGMGADEQMGGYGRHRTAYRKGGWEGLAAELASDRARLWVRNLGRDDRVVSDHGREARFPFLDECVVATLGATPLHLLCDPRHEAGVGDKLVLRCVARRIGLARCASLQKRAIQFGTRIANRHVSGDALLGPDVRLDEIVHPSAAAAAAAAARLAVPCHRRGGATPPAAQKPRESLAKPRRPAAERRT